MIKTSIMKMAEDIGFDIGCSDDLSQSNLLNGFCKGISNSMDEGQRGTQICYFVDKLNPKSVAVIKEIYEFIKIKEEK